MGKRKKEEEEEEEEEGQAAAACVSVPIDLLPEILSRVPYRSLCRFKCVSRAWLALCSDPAVRRRSPQTLSGFFRYSLSYGYDYDYDNRPSGLDFFNLSGRGRPMIDPSLPFLRGYEHLTLVNCCDGVLLCTVWDRTMERVVFVVCNPATQDIWAARPLPDLREPGGYPLVLGTYIICLCFNPAVPRRFAVFLFVRDGWRIKSVQVYSSDTREWTSMACGWGPQIVVRDVQLGYLFLNGTMHFTAFNGDDPEETRRLLIATVDMEGNTWSTIRVPPGAGFSPVIGQSQGRLCVMQKDKGNGCRLSVWVLEDHASGQWTLKHTASVLELLGRPSHEPSYESYKLVAIHPERNMIFLQDGALPDQAFMSYDMDSKKRHLICTLERYDVLMFWPYIPCFAEQPSVAQKISGRLLIR